MADHITPIHSRLVTLSCKILYCMFFLHRNQRFVRTSVTMDCTRAERNLFRVLSRHKCQVFDVCAFSSLFSYFRTVNLQQCRQTLVQQEITSVSCLSKHFLAQKAKHLCTRSTVYLSCSCNCLTLYNCHRYTCAFLST